MWSERKQSQLPHAIVELPIQPCQSPTLRYPGVQKSQPLSSDAIRIQVCRLIAARCTLSEACLVFAEYVSTVSSHVVAIYKAVLCEGR